MGRKRSFRGTCICSLGRGSPQAIACYYISFINVDCLAEENRMKKLISKETIEKLKNKVKGQIVLPSDSSYDKVREIYGMR